MGSDENVDRLGIVRVIDSKDEYFQSLFDLGKMQGKHFAGVELLGEFNAQSRYPEIYKGVLLYMSSRGYQEKKLRTLTRNNILVYLGSGKNFDGDALLCADVNKVGGQDVGLWFMPHGYSLFRDELKNEGFCELVVRHSNKEAGDLKTENVEIVKRSVNSE